MPSSFAIRLFLLFILFASITLYGQTYQSFYKYNPINGTFDVLVNQSSIYSGGQSSTSGSGTGGYFPRHIKRMSQAQKQQLKAQQEEQENERLAKIMASKIISLSRAYESMNFEEAYGMVTEIESDQYKKFVYPGNEPFNLLNYYSILLHSQYKRSFEVLNKYTAFFVNAGNMDASKDVLETLLPPFGGCYYVKCFGDSNFTSGLKGLDIEDMFRLDLAVTQAITSFSESKKAASYFAEIMAFYSKRITDLSPFYLPISQTLISLGQNELGLSMLKDYLNYYRSAGDMESMGKGLEQFVYRNYLTIIPGQEDTAWGKLLLQQIDFIRKNSVSNIVNRLELQEIELYKRLGKYAEAATICQRQSYSAGEDCQYCRYKAGLISREDYFISGQYPSNIPEKQIDNAILQMKRMRETGAYEKAVDVFEKASEIKYKKIKIDGKKIEHSYEDMGYTNEYRTLTGEMGLTSFEMKDFKNAKKYLKEAAEQSPLGVYAYYYGKCFIQEGNIIEAKKVFRKVARAGRRLQKEEAELLD